MEIALAQFQKVEHLGVRNQFKSLQTLEYLHSDPLSSEAELRVAQGKFSS